MNLAKDEAITYLEDRPVLTRRCAVLLGVGVPVLLAAVGAWLVGTAPVDRLELVTLDWRFQLRGPLPARRDVVVVEISEDSRRELKHGDQVFCLREHLPAAINNLAEARALGLGLDFWLEDLTDPDADVALADALAGTDVLLAVAHAAGRLKRAPEMFRRSSTGEGTITVYPDADGVLRRLPSEACLAVLGDDLSPEEYIPQFPLAAAMFGLWENAPDAEIACGADVTRVGDRVVPVGALVDYLTVDREGWTTLAFEDVVRNQFDPDLVDGSIVLVGMTRTIEDAFPTPLAEVSVPGVYYHANVVSQVLDDRWFSAVLVEGAAPRWVTALLGLLAGLFGWYQRPWWRHRRGAVVLLLYVGGGLLVFVGGWLGASYVLFTHHVLTPVAGPVAIMGLALGSGLAGQWVVLGVEMRRAAARALKIEAILGQSVSHAVLDAVKADPQAIARTQVREVSVLFCDLRGFTATAGGLAPEAVAELLNEYFNHITSAVFENDGFVDKFVGDEIMAVFSAPLVQPDHPVRAVRSAIAIKRYLAELNERRASRGEPPLECGIGIHTGPAAAGHIGSRDRSNYTVVGHTINLAARIEGFTRGGEILISAAVRQHLTDDVPVEFWEQVRIRGCDEPHDLYRVRFE